MGSIACHLIIYSIGAGICACRDGCGIWATAGQRIGDRIRCCATDNSSQGDKLLCLTGIDQRIGRDDGCGRVHTRERDSYQRSGIVGRDDKRIFCWGLTGCWTTDGKGIGNTWSGTTCRGKAGVNQFLHDDVRLVDVVTGSGRDGDGHRASRIIHARYCDTTMGGTFNYDVCCA